jgi:hypothetical protein
MSDYTNKKSLFALTGEQAIVVIKKQTASGGHF